MDLVNLTGEAGLNPRIECQERKVYKWSCFSPPCVAALPCWPSSTSLHPPKQNPLRQGEKNCSSHRPHFYRFQTMISRFSDNGICVRPVLKLFPPSCLAFLRIISYRAQYQSRRPPSNNTEVLQDKKKVCIYTNLHQLQRCALLILYEWIMLFHFVFYHTDTV